MYIFALLLCVTSMLYAESNNQPHADQKEIPIVKGDIFIVPNRFYKPTKGYCDLHYCKHSILDTQGNPIPIQDNDDCVDVRATDEGAEDTIDNEERRQQKAQNISCNWKDHGHPVLKTFPIALPYSLLKNKKEGDILEFVYKSEREQETYKVILTCRQTKYRYRRFGTFEHVLDCLNRNERRVFIYQINEPVINNTQESAESN